MAEVRDRRGRAARGEVGLLERNRALAAIDALLSDPAEAQYALLIAGHAGMGKTRLHEAALDRGRRGDLLVVRAAGAELEQNVALGVAGQLLRSLLHELAPGERQTLLDRAPRALNTLMGRSEDAEPVVDEDLAVSHALFSVLADAVQARPALLAIDDLHWADAASLEFVLYTLHRLAELPIALMLTRRPTAGGNATEILDHIAAHPRVELERLSPLGPAGVRELVADALGPRGAGELADVCLETTGGNPFYLHELLLALADEPELDAQQLASRARALAPDAVTRSLRVRVGRLGADAVALARAVAVLGDDVPLRQAAALGGLEIQRAGAAADALAAVEVLLAREPLRFVHPLVRHAIERDTPGSERSSRHLDAARLLYAEGEAAERVAAHLLLGRPEASEWVVEQLRAAARQARAQAAPQSALRYLERALIEPPAEQIRGAVLAELGSAEAALGLSSATEHLEAASNAKVDSRSRAELALQRGRALHAQGRHEQAAAAFEEGLLELASAGSEREQGDLHDRLQIGFVASASIVPRLQPQALERLGALVKESPSTSFTNGHRLALAQAAINASFSNRAASEVLDLADRAWDGGRLLDAETSFGVSWILVAAACCLAGDLERSLEICDAAVADAQRRAAPLAFATASFMRGLPQLWRGNVTAAMADLELARDARRYGWQQYVRSAAGHYCLCLIESGQRDRADGILTEDAPLEEPYDAEDAIRLYVLAELCRRQGQPQEALAVALAAGAAAQRTIPFLGYCPWRTTAAQAAMALGERDRALSLAAEAVARSEQTGVLHQRIRALRVAGICEGGKLGLAKLHEAVELGHSSPPRLETIYALIDLGGVLRRSGERAAARKPLQLAADMARTGGVSSLYELARTELAATGARPRREKLLSGVASLTPSERRIADLAASGRSNREIAGELFVTPKTVEYHLRNAYRKLNVDSRRELQGALEPSRPGEDAI